VACKGIMQKKGVIFQLNWEKYVGRWAARSNGPKIICFGP